VIVTDVDEPEESSANSARPGSWSFEHAGVTDPNDWSRIIERWRSELGAPTSS
jgi:hypothetical protein